MRITHLRNRRGRLRTDFGARILAPRGSVAHYRSGMVTFDEVANLTPDAWEAIKAWGLRQPSCLACGMRHGRDECPYRVTSAP